MTFDALRKPFNFKAWIDDHSHLLKPPVGNKLVYEDSGLIVQVVGGPNQRVDFHDDPAEEFFYQLRGDMVIKIADGGKIHDVVMREGDIFMLPPHVRHSPQRPMPGSVGLVVEGARIAGVPDAFEWFCFSCGNRLHRIEVEVTNLVKDLPPLYEAFYSDEVARTCTQCGSVHPGKTPPEGWASLPV
jgi:3-hydroxyanthranilate 3,4-dioxygenase